MRSIGDVRFDTLTNAIPCTIMLHSAATTVSVILVLAHRLTCLSCYSEKPMLIYQRTHVLSKSDATQTTGKRYPLKTRCVCCQRFSMQRSLTVFQAIVCHVRPACFGVAALYGHADASLFSLGPLLQPTFICRSSKLVIHRSLLQPCLTSLPEPQWPYTGRKYGSAFMGPPMPGMPMPFDDDPSSPQNGPPMPMPGMPPNFSPYAYRFAVSYSAPLG